MLSLLEAPRSFAPQAATPPSALSIELAATDESIHVTLPPSSIDAQDLLSEKCEGFKIGDKVWVSDSTLNTFGKEGVVKAFYQDGFYLVHFVDGFKREFIGECLTLLGGAT